MSRDMFGNDLTKGDSFGTPRTASIELCEDHNEPICGECGYCAEDPEHLKHSKQPLDAGAATARLWTLTDHLDLQPPREGVAFIDRQFGDGSGRTLAEVHYYKSFRDGGPSLEEVRANARLIVTAVNSYDALKEVADIARAMLIRMDLEVEQGNSEFPNAGCREDLRNALNRVRQERDR